ncbi:MAG: hypothetical protein HZB68_02245 [Candidatus Aenigmarchaeota archaeon]|nr:hypothetical protein [Candidatus Aenigmarchaeota archaeon]
MAEETAIDQLLKLVNERGKIGLDAASVILKIDKGIIEKWAKALDEKGILFLNYGLTETTLESTGMGKVDREIKSKEYEGESRDLRKKAMMIQDESKGKEKIIESMDSKIRRFEERMKNEVNSAERAFTSLLEMTKRRDSIMENMKSIEEMEKKTGEKEQLIRKEVVDMDTGLQAGAKRLEDAKRSVEEFHTYLSKEILELGKRKNELASLETEEKRMFMEEEKLEKLSVSLKTDMDRKSKEIDDAIKKFKNFQLEMKKEVDRIKDYGIEIRKLEQMEQLVETEAETLKKKVDETERKAEKIKPSFLELLGFKKKKAEKK